MLVRILDAVSEVSRDQWNECVPLDFPALSHEYVTALEAGIVAGNYGIAPRYHCVFDSADNLLGLCVAYLKFTSAGEIGTDFGWSLAYRTFSGDYYPKIQVELPFTPVTVPPFSVRAGVDVSSVRALLLQALVETRDRESASSVQFSYLEDADAKWLEQQGFVLGQGIQYLFENPGFGSFDEYHAGLRKQQRNNIRREHESLVAQGVWYEFKPLAAVGAELLDTFASWYADSQRRNGVKDYLSQAFFRALLDCDNDRVVCAIAYKDDTPVAMIVCLLAGDSLLGLYWGGMPIKHLYFHLAISALIEIAIERKLRFVNFGAGGSHKGRRGAAPSWVTHAYQFRDHRFQAAVLPGIEKRRRRLIEQYSIQ